MRILIIIILSLHLLYMIVLEMYDWACRRMMLKWRKKDKE
jgi:hypothetical protein